MKIFLSGLKKEIKNNWKSGVSVAMVSIPLSFSLAIAAGASPMTGIITAVWAGLVGGIVGGSQFNIIGPAGALAGILIVFAISYGPAILPILAIFSGLIILVVWLLGWDKYLIFVPSSVVHGFTLGVALTIGLGQINSAFGLSGLPVHDTSVLNTLESLRHLGMVSWSAVIPFILGLLVMFVLLKFRPSWPNSIIVAILGILFGYASIHGVLPFHLQTVGTKYPGLSNNLFVFPKLASVLFYGSRIMLVLKSSVVVAFIAILETLLSAKTADGMTKTKFRQGREVMGLGLANVASGIFGGLPATGVFARTALNIKSGAKSNYSQIINAVAVGVISVIFISGFNYLPLSITASILVYVSIRMITAEHFKKLFKFDKSAFALSFVVAALTFGYDATTGILVGTLASLLLFAHKLSSTELGSETDPENFNPEDEKEEAIIYRFAGPLTYLNSKTHIERLNLITPTKPIILNFRHAHYIDVDGFESLDEIVESLEDQKCSVYISGVKPEMMDHFNEHSWFKKMVSQNKVFGSTDEVLKVI